MNFYHKSQFYMHLIYFVWIFVLTKATKILFSDFCLTPGLLTIQLNMHILMGVRFLMDFFPFDVEIN